MELGDAGLAVLSPALRKAESRLGRQVNVTNYSASEFRSKAASGDHFITTVLHGPKNFVKGSQRDLVQKHKTSKKELDDMREVIERDLTDPAILGLSADRWFATAYNAALQAAGIAIACAGYRVTARIGHHMVAIECAKFVLGATADKYADYFETCRRKRNIIDYTRSHVGQRYGS